MAFSATTRATVGRLAAEARFIFTGRVEAEGTSSLAAIPSGTTTAVARVERVHRAAPALQGQAGQLVTLLGATSRGTESRYVFFTNPVLYGETLGVRELGRLDVPEEIGDLDAMLVELTEEAKTCDLRQHLASADAVLHARVRRVHRVSEATAATASEHDPDWWAAILQVIAALKGEHKREVSARYPNSRDVRWFGVPKPRQGQEGQEYT